jgi:hypothetical protein
MISILKRNSSRTYSSSFGITPTILTTGFFSLNYIGLEDDHDMGVKFTHTDKKWNYSLAFSRMPKSWGLVTIPMFQIAGIPTM